MREKHLQIIHLIRDSNTVYIKTLKNVNKKNKVSDSKMSK